VTARESVVGYLLLMSDEIHDWLADLRGSDLSAAMFVGEALVALMSEGASLGPPLVASLAGPRDLRICLRPWVSPTRTSWNR
jgi:hypothetical protein